MSTRGGSRPCSNCPQGMLPVEAGGTRSGRSTARARMYRQYPATSIMPGMIAPTNRSPHGNGLRIEDIQLQLRLLIGAGQDIPEKHQGDGGRNDLTQRAGGADGARGYAAAVARAQHTRQRQQTHGHYRGADDSRTGREQHAHEHHGDRQTPAEAPEQRRHAVEQLFRNPRFFEGDSHEHKEGNGDQGEIVHRAEQAPGQRFQKCGIEASGNRSDGGEQQRRTGEGEGHGIAEHKQQTDCRKHAQGHHTAHDRTSLRTSRVALRSTSAQPATARLIAISGSSVLSI